MVLEMYRLVRPSSITAALEEHNAIGFDKLIKATKEEKVSKTVTRGDLVSDEFISLTSELLSALSGKGIDRTIIFGDEANHIDPNIETDIIKRNFEVFAEGNVQFVLTARQEVISEFSQLRDAFPAFLEVKPFDEATILDNFRRPAHNLFQMWRGARVFPGKSTASMAGVKWKPHGDSASVPILRRLCDTQGEVWQSLRSRFGVLRRGVSPHI
jgi:hypothetical protein